MRKLVVSLSCLVLIAGCGSSGGRRGPNKPGGGGNSDGGVSNAPPDIPGCDVTKSGPNDDQDHDGYTPATGDCNDCNPSINPGAIQIPGDPTDYACNGMPGIVPSCAGASGVRDANSLANAMDLCPPFLKSATLVGPSDQRGRKVLDKFGILMPRAGSNFSLISSGIAADKNDPDYSKMNGVDPGTDFTVSGGMNQSANPQPNLPGVMGCSQAQPTDVFDYTELVVKLKAPTNVNSFSFDFQFLSAEYPVYVCTQFNDEFLVLQESQGEFQSPTNIAFDMQKNPVTVNNGFFTVCTNDTSKPQTQHCTKPVSDIAGTGFEDPPGGGGGGGPPCMTTADCFGLGMCVNKVCQLGGLGGGSIPGGSTGWLTTTAPVTPGEDVTLHFIIFDEGDHILDSAALIDNFRWGTSVVMTPTTGPIM